MSLQINLYNPAFIPKRELLTAHTLAGAVAVAVLGVAVGSAWAQYRAAQLAKELLAAQAAQTAAQGQLESTRVATAARPPSPALVADVASKKRRLEQREAVLSALKGGLTEPGTGFSSYLQGLARQSVSGLWLTGFSVSGGGEGMVLQGRVVDKALIGSYVRKLNSEKAFVGKSFATMVIGSPGELVPAAAEARPAVVPPMTEGNPRGTPASAVSVPAKVPAASVLEFQLTADKVAEPAEVKK